MPQATLPILDCTQPLAVEPRNERSRIDRVRKPNVSAGFGTGLAISRCGFVTGIKPEWTAFLICKPCVSSSVDCSVVQAIGAKIHNCESTIAVGGVSSEQPSVDLADLHQARPPFLFFATTSACQPNWCSSQRNTGPGNARKYHARSYSY